MKVFGLAGWSGSGKTTMLTRLLPALIERGLSVSTIKHAHHDFDIDQPGKDSYRHRMAGANQVMISSAHRWALMRELRGAHEPNLQELLAQLAPVDLVMVEGFKHDPYDKLEVYRASVGKPLLAREDPHIVAVASDAPIDRLALPQLDIEDTSAIADFVLRHCGLGRRHKS
jgi:molybdopterin-guanine dinucleotide biosynthesis protein B